ncbi:aspartate aminotransferase, mitochondrial-like [Dysidea avara]|uniref:aspartate aminotransferase, mitochondrial-like n=1 Tax=Dysidea avara TaxID=196820 RepID=UPI0033323BE3
MALLFTGRNLLKGNSATVLAKASTGAVIRKSSWWSHVEEGPPDVIFGVVEAYNRDDHPQKVNLGIGAYRDDNGKPWVLPVVRKAEKMLQEKELDKEYAGIMGYETFRKAAAKLAFGPQGDFIENGLYTTAQTISGTGALRLAANYLKKYFPYDKKVYVPDRTWGNHVPVLSHAGLATDTYKYYNPNTCMFDPEGAYDSLKNLPKNSLVLFHACAHNPTGADPYPEHWEEISKICKDRNHFIFIDMAYQGYATGDLNRDAFAVRQFVKDGHKLLLTQSFAKNMGLYGERVGAMTILTDSKEETKAVESQVKIIIRPMWANPPINGARIATIILSTKELYDQWLVEVKSMADRTILMRERLHEGLEKEGSKLNWSHITGQIGMFCFSGLNEQQVQRLRDDFHIYMTKDGRISIVALTTKNVDYVAKAIHEVTK